MALVSLELKANLEGGLEEVSRKNLTSAEPTVGLTQRPKWQGGGGEGTQKAQARGHCAR